MKEMALCAKFFSFYVSNCRRRGVVRCASRREHRVQRRAQSAIRCYAMRPEGALRSNVPQQRMDTAFAVASRCSLVLCHRLELAH